MSKTLSPSTGRLVKVGSKEFADLLNSPIWGSHFTSPLTSIGNIGKGIPVNGVPLIPLYKLPEIPISLGGSLSPMNNNNNLLFSPVVLPQLKPMNITSVGPLSLPSDMNQVGILSPVSALSPITTTFGFTNVPKQTIPKQTNILSPIFALPPLTQVGSGAVSPIFALPPLTQVRSGAVSPIFSLPPLTQVGSKVGSGAVSPIFALPLTQVGSKVGSGVVSPIFALPPLTQVGSNAGSDQTGSVASPVSAMPPIIMPTFILSPTVSILPSIKKEVGLPSVPLMNESHLENILSLPTYNIPTLEDVLKKTRQPYLQKSLKGMIETEKQYEGRGIKTRGWRALAPQKGHDRHQLMAECGNACFLRPDNEGFPICPKCQFGDEKCICALICKGIQ